MNNLDLICIQRDCLGSEELYWILMEGGLVAFARNFQVDCELVSLEPFSWEHCDKKL